MLKTIMVLLIMTTTISAQNILEEKIIGMEKAALERWNNGDPSGFLEISADDVAYFDPFLEQRLDGHKKLTELYESIRGKVKVTYYEMLNPKVQSVKDMAVLTFNLNSYDDDRTSKWNCTEVYKLQQNGSWKIVETHWSYTKPNIKEVNSKSDYQIQRTVEINTVNEIEQKIIDLELSAFEKWKNGDLNRFLELSAEEVVYFDPYLEKRLDGLMNLKNLYEPANGTFTVDKYEMINPKVNAVSEMAVLTFNFISYFYFAFV